MTWPHVSSVSPQECFHQGVFHAQGSKAPCEAILFRNSCTIFNSPAGIAHLDPSLPNVYGDDLPHVETLEFYFWRVQPSMWAAGTASHILANLEKALAPFCPAAALRMFYLIIPALAMEGGG